MATPRPGGNDGSFANWITRRWWQGSANPLLVPVAALFGLLVRLRRWLYRRGFLETADAGVPVVVVGNLTVGGSGKTPVVSWLTRRVQARGQRVGIVSRGYGGSIGDEPALVEPSGSPAVFGDEPVLLARLTGAPVCVCRRRDRAVARLAPEVDLVVADDGLQHYRMARAAEVVVVDGARGFGNGRLLPAGPLREPTARAGEADVVLRHGQQADFELVPDHLRSVSDGAVQRPLELLDEDVPVVAVAAIGHPERFFERLRERLGDRLVETRPFPDHWAFEAGDFSGLEQRRVVMTAKDAVKCVAFAGMDWRSLEVEPVMTPAAATRLDALLARILSHRCEVQ